MKPELSIETLKGSAAEYARLLSTQGVPELFGVTDGKAIGTHVEHGFKDYIHERFALTSGNSASGIDFPEVQVDLKVTSAKQPQSSCPFRNATQKIYGLGYSLLVLVYEKIDDQETQTARLKFVNALFIGANRTADYQMTKHLIALAARGGLAEEVDAFLEEKNLPLDSESRRQLAERILAEPPALGGLTMSNALQWRLQYGRAIGLAQSESDSGISDLIA